MKKQYVLELKIDTLPSNQMNSRKSWRGNHKEGLHWDSLIHFHTIGKRPKQPLRRAKLTLVRHSARSLDWDNLAATWKHPVDALVTCGILSDDAWSVIGLPTIDQVKAPMKAGYVTIRVEEIQDTMT